MEIKQNTPEWHEWRKQGIGASEANIIMGVSKFSTPLDLWEEKVNGKKKEVSEFITQKGHNIEAQFRPHYELVSGSDFPSILATHEKYPWIRASLDGYSKELNHVWECKYCGEDDFQRVVGKIGLDQYYPQIQHQLMVTGAVKAILFVVTEEKDEQGKQIKGQYKSAYMSILPDEHYMAKLFMELEIFWNQVQNKISPEISKDDVLSSKDKDLKKLITAYKKAHKLADKYSGQVNELKESIFAAIPHNKMECNGVKITVSTSKASSKPDYEKYCKHHNFEMKDFMKTVSGRITKRITVLTQ